VNVEISKLSVWQGVAKM